MLETRVQLVFEHDDPVLQKLISVFDQYNEMHESASAEYTPVVQPDLVLPVTDINNPHFIFIGSHFYDKEGYEVCAEIREAQKYNTPSIIGVHAIPEERALWLESGANGALQEKYLSRARTNPTDVLEMYLTYCTELRNDEDIYERLENPPHLGFLGG